MGTRADQLALSVAEVTRDMEEIVTRFRRHGDHWEAELVEDFMTPLQQAINQYNNPDAAGTANEEVKQQ
jgi:hypothetical protein